MPFTAILFDLDGTILDTTPLILASLRHATSRVLGRTPEDHILLRNFGRPLEDSLRALAPDLDEVRFNEFCQEYLDHNQREHDRLVGLVPGVEAVLAGLSARGVKLGIVTSKRREMSVRGLNFFGLARYFEIVVAREDTQRHKPGPEPVAEGLRRLGVEARQVLYIGDSPYDMQAGHAAGTSVWGLLHNTFTPEVLKAAGAQRVAGGWHEIGEWLGLAEGSDAASNSATMKRSD